VILVEKRSHRGWPNTYFLSNGTVELAVLADVGPRVIHYGFAGGENQFTSATSKPACAMATSSAYTGVIAFGSGRKSRAPITPTIALLR
jgi:hypothetical protein